MARKNYVLHTHYLTTGKGWEHDEVEVNNATYEAAASLASRVAHDLDKEFGDSHFWTVDLKNPEGNSYFQLFHGRLS